MRIAVLTNDDPGHPSGGAGVIAGIYNVELAKRGYEIMVWSSVLPPLGPPQNHSDPWHPETRRAGSPQSSVIHRLFSHLVDLFPKKSLINEIVQWRPDALITHNLTGCGFATPKIVASHGVRWIHFLHDVQLFEPSGRIVHGESFSFLRKAWRRVWSYLRRLSLSEPDAVISPTRWLLDFHKQFGFFWKSQTVVIPNPISFDIQTTHYSLLTTDFLYIGRLDSDKGVQVLVHAWQSLGTDRPVLHIIGEGELRMQIERLNDDKLVLYGQMPNAKVQEFLERQPIVIVPSLVYENQPTVILEALAHGCNVIASEVGGIPETVSGAGWLVTAGNPEALAKAMRQALQGKTIPEAARQSVLGRHFVEVAVDALLSTLKSNR